MGASLPATTLPRSGGVSEDGSRPDARPGFHELTIRHRRSKLALIALLGLVLAAGILATGIGAMTVAPAQVVAILAGKIGLTLPVEFAAYQDNVVWMLRIPRVLFAVLVGGGLALSGASMQGLFRNPLADPALTGVSGGAALGAVCSIILGTSGMGQWVLSLAAFAGGLAAALLVARLSRVEGRTSVAHMLLAGIAINAFTWSGIGLATYLADDAQLRSITFWNLGSLGAATWKSLLVLAAFVVVPAVFLHRQKRVLNALLLGESEAGQLGFEVEDVKRRIVFATAVLVGGAVAATGIIGFVGLVAPHLVRLALGPDHRTVLPASFLLGALLLLIADTLCRTVAAPAEIPIGVVTALLGAPFFLYLLQSRRGFL
jgi:iron complex transport system permease protein